MIYIVAYPHPEIPREERMFPFKVKVDSETYKEDLVEGLIEEYPEHSRDLKRVTIWKVSRLSINQPPLTKITGSRAPYKDIERRFQ